MKRLISQTARNKISQLLPGLDNYPCDCPRENHWGMLRALMFNPYMDEETGSVRLGAETVARAVGQYDNYLKGHFNAGKHINHFIHFVAPNIAQVLKDDQGREWSTATWIQDEQGFKKTDDGKQRRVLVNLPEEIKKILNDELVGLHTDEKVYFTTGKLRNLTAERLHLRGRVEEAQNEINILNCPTAKYIASYHNSLPTNSFTKILDNYEDAKRAILQIENPHTRHQQLLILNSIKESPKPVYKPTDKSDRLFGFGANITNLKKEVRKTLTRGWFEFDLKSAQLAIVAKVWGIPELEAFLESGKSFWKEIISYLNLPYTQEAKEAIKKATYALIFGMSKKNLKTEITSSLGVSSADLFLKNPLVEIILKARTRYMETIINQGYVVDPFFVVHEVNKKNVLSIMAREAQSYEQVLLYPVYQLLNETDDFSIVLLQHDGLSVNFTKEETKKYWIERICFVVDETAKSLGIFTKLEFEENKEVGKEVKTSTCIKCPTKISDIGYVVEDVIDVKRGPYCSYLCAHNQIISRAFRQSELRRIVSYPVIRIT